MRSAACNYRTPQKFHSQRSEYLRRPPTAETLPFSPHGGRVRANKIKYPRMNLTKAVRPSVQHAASFFPTEQNCVKTVSPANESSFQIGQIKVNRSRPYGEAKMFSISSRSSEPNLIDYRDRLGNYGLTTARILYRFPDYPALLQTYVWQEFDIYPKFPSLNLFLKFWVEKIEGPLHSVTVAHAKLIRPSEIQAIDREFRLQ